MKRFWDKVDKSETCWNWTAYRDPRGYGRFSIGGIPGYAHRISQEMVSGPIPPGMDIDHTCHNRACVNPAHLRVVSHKQNHENRKGAARNSASGIRGVSWHTKVGKWRAVVRHNGKQVSGGYFDDVNEAAEAVKQLRLRLFTHNDLDRTTPKSKTR